MCGLVSRQNGEGTYEIGALRSQHLAIAVSRHVAVDRLERQTEADEVKLRTLGVLQDLVGPELRCRPRGGPPRSSSSGALRCKTVPVGQPLTAPAVMPLTMNRLAVSANRITGAMTSTA